MTQRLALARLDKRGRKKQRKVFEAGDDGLIQWINLAAWTYDPRQEIKNLPFLTWPVQAAAARALWGAVTRGGDVLIDKSRDMGATWLCLAAFVWFWLFVPATPLLVASRKEEYVDAGGNPDSLFWKLDYLVRGMPRWLRPSIQRRHMHLGNLDNGSVIDGESTNGDLGRGGRRKAILLDEFASVEEGDAILAATADASPCRIFNSTPQGRGNAFARVRFSGKVPVVTLHWKDHPLKGRSAALETDAQTGSARWTSPWYRDQCARRTSRKEIAQELDIDYLASGDAFFDLDVCQRIRASGQLGPPLHRGELQFAVDTSPQGGHYGLGPVRWTPDAAKRRLGLWCPLVADAHGGLRPPGDRHYVAFADISHGQGASNSVIKVAWIEGGEEAASFVCADTPPHELAHYAVALCKWFGGANGWAMLGWEANGPGGIFGLEVQRLGHPYTLKTRNLDQEDPAPDGRMGWHSTRRGKENLLGGLRRALARNELVLHEEATVAEAEQYIYYPSGAIGPSALVQEAQGARSAHGDRVIAAAGLVLCLAEHPQQAPPAAPPPADSFEQRHREAVKVRDSAGQW